MMAQARSVGCGRVGMELLSRGHSSGHMRAAGHVLVPAVDAGHRLIERMLLRPNDYGRVKSGNRASASDPPMMSLAPSWAGW